MANMDLETIDDNPQIQRLTIALKNICRDYPAGGTVLRELLQNADDAGATVVVRNFRATSKGVTKSD
jgi:sacsin